MTAATDSPARLSTGRLPDPDPAWAPAVFTPSVSPVSDGPDLCEFASAMLSVNKGMLAGNPLELTSWQRWLISRLLERQVGTGLLRFSTALVGLGRKNGKSLIGTALALDHLLFGPRGAEVYSAAKDRMQARIVFGEAVKQIQRSPELSALCRVSRDAIEVPSRDSVYRALSADAGAAQGLSPSLVIADEIHVWPSNDVARRGDELWEALTLGSGARPEAQVIAITTAGANLDSLLGRLFEYGCRVARGEVHDDTFGLFWWAAPENCDIDDRGGWRAANPNLAEGLLREADVESAWRQQAWPAFRRYRLNQWVALHGEGLLAGDRWDAAASDARLSAGEQVALGFDGSISQDATALVAVGVDSGVVELVGLWEPDLFDPGWLVPRDLVDETVADVFDRFDVRLLWADPAFWEQEIGQWAERWPRRVERIPMSNQRMAPLTAQWLADVAELRITHTGDPRLRRHVLNASARDTAYGVTFSKQTKRSPRKIDAVAAMVLATGARNAVLDDRERVARREDAKVLVL